MIVESGTLPAKRVFSPGCLKQQEIFSARWRRLERCRFIVKQRK